MDFWDVIPFRRSFGVIYIRLQLRRWIKIRTFDKLDFGSELETLSIIRGLHGEELIFYRKC